MNPATKWNERFTIVREGLTWNEAVQEVQRRRAIARTDSESTLAGDSATAPLPLPPPETSLTQKCSSCSCGSRRLRAGAEGPAGLRQVEAKLYNAELEEAVSDERTEATRERLRRAAQVLEAQVLFSQSLDLKARALARLTKVTGNFACAELLPSNELDRVLDEIRWDVGGLGQRLAEVADAAGAAVETPERLYQLMDDFREKNKEFHGTSNKFSQYLKSSDWATTNKLKKLESQYSYIRRTYDQSRKMLEKELSKLIEERRAIVEQCFSKLAPLQEIMIGQDEQFLALTKEVIKGLQEPKKKTCRCSQKCNS